MIFTNAYLITNDDDEEGIISLGTFLSRGDTEWVKCPNK